jgi:hypothetical protein
MRFCFGPILDLGRGGYAGKYLGAICVMAVVQYIANSGLVALYSSYKNGQPFWTTWHVYYFWTSVTYLPVLPLQAYVYVIGGVSLCAAIIITRWWASSI